jgi:hypothetical protein
VLVGIFISLDLGVSQNPHENQVILVSVDLVHHSHHLGVVDFPHPIQGCEATQQIAENHPLRLNCVSCIEIAELIASASALKIKKGLGSRISVFSPGVTTAHPTLSSIFDPFVYIWV